jgi:hypothetical protein
MKECTITFTKNGVRYTFEVHAPQEAIAEAVATFVAGTIHEETGSVTVRYKLLKQS